MKNISILLVIGLCLFAQDKPKFDLSNDDRYALAKLYLQQAQIVLNQYKLSQDLQNVQKAIDLKTDQLKSKCATSGMNISFDDQGDMHCVLKNSDKK